MMYVATESETETERERVSIETDHDTGESAKRGDPSQDGWSSIGYSMSKSMHYSVTATLVRENPKLADQRLLPRMALNREGSASWRCAAQNSA
jgi:hypothetical protein